MIWFSRHGFARKIFSSNVSNTQTRSNFHTAKDLFAVLVLFGAVTLKQIFPSDFVCNLISKCLIWEYLETDVIPSSWKFNLVKILFIESDLKYLRTVYIPHATQYIDFGGLLSEDLRQVKCQRSEMMNMQTTKGFVQSQNITSLSGISKKILLSTQMIVLTILSLILLVGNPVLPNLLPPRKIHLWQIGYLRKELGD